MSQLLTARRSVLQVFAASTERRNRRLHFAALYTAVTPFPADHTFSERYSDRMIIVLHDVIGDRVIPFAVSAL